MEAENKKEASAMIFGDASLKRSKSFINALQELKNLRPQLYSAAEYCEKSYLHSEQKQMVLDNLKEYAMRALVNAVDHLGTVAYKLNDLLEQQTVAVNTMDLKLTSLNQKILTCRTYMDKEGMRQQKLMAVVPRHHKRYVLPSSVRRKVHFSPTVHVHARPRATSSASPSSKTLSWHLDTEPKSPTKATQKSSASSAVQKTSQKSTGVFHLLDNEEEDSQAKSSTAAQPQSLSRNPASDAPVQLFGTINKDSSIRSKPVTPFKSMDNHTKHQHQHQQIICAPPRTKSMLSSFFAKQKTQKLKAGVGA
ncbi:hypothetical protein V2J09_024317 [Rumex salicifolius]